MYASLEARAAQTARRRIAASLIHWSNLGEWSKVESILNYAHESGDAKSLLTKLITSTESRIIK